jgi:hypothetical protein
LYKSIRTSLNFKRLRIIGTHSLGMFKVLCHLADFHNRNRSSEKAEGVERERERDNM